MVASAVNVGNVNETLEGQQSSSKVDDQKFDALDKAIVAELTAEQIVRMTCDELVRVILVADMALLQPEARAKLKFYDRETLQRLAFLARRCCRNLCQ